MNENEKLITAYVDKEVYKKWKMKKLHEEGRANLTAFIRESMETFLIKSKQN